MNKNKIIDVLRLVAGNNIIITITHRRNGITSNVIVNKVFNNNTIEEARTIREEIARKFINRRVAIIDNDWHEVD